MAIEALTGARVFTGETLLDDMAVVIEAGTIVRLVPEATIGPGVHVTRLDGGVLAPGFVDAQVNGGGGVLFNASPDVEGLKTIAAAHARHGTTALLPTFITDRPDGMRAAIAAVRAAMSPNRYDNQDVVPGIVGIHLEGPFIAQSRKGAHDAALIRPMEAADVALLLQSGLSIVLLTVAPETVSPREIAVLARHGVIVSLGHSDASFDLALAAVAAGARGVTHLFNAMSPLGHREPGLVGATLETGDLWAGLIADGHHVDAAALRVALRAKCGPGRLFLVTDAMPTAGHDEDYFLLNGRIVTRTDGRLTLADGTLAGSDLTMDKAVRFAVERLRLDLGEALRMASLYPAQFLRLDKTRGRVAAGYRADLVHLSDDLAVAGVWIGGRRMPS
jgi:N-acetylglucosamine-6-phosphate deacetylase